MQPHGRDISRGPISLAFAWRAVVTMLVLLALIWGCAGRDVAAPRGIEQVRHVILDRMGTLDFDQQTEDLIDADDKVVVLVRWVGRGKASGAQGEISMAMVWTVQEQAITRIEFFLDRAQALEAVGLRE